MGMSMRSGHRLCQGVWSYSGIRKPPKSSKQGNKMANFLFVDKGETEWRQGCE